MMGPTERRAFDAGYEAGESSQLADWQFALDDILPDEIEVSPAQVKEYILALQRKVEQRDELAVESRAAKERRLWAESARNTLARTTRT